MFARSLAADQESNDSADAAPSNGAGTPEYSFEGYTVEFSEKVMLTPPAEAANGR
jgi:hypothetical protein